MAWNTFVYSIGHRTLRIDLQLGTLLVTDQSLLLSLPAAHPNIIHVSFTPHEWDDRREGPEASSIISTVSSDIVCGWNHLTYVNIAIPLAPRALLHLRDMPLLHVVRLTLEDSEGFEYLSRPSQSAFIAFRELSISCSSVLSCSAFLNAMSWHHLESIEVNLPSVPYDPADDDAVCMKMFFQVLSAQCSTTSLKRIFLAAYRFMPTNILDYTIEEDMLNPLLSFSDLTVLEICSCHAFRISNKSRLSLAGLVPLVQYCNDLVHLGIIVDATIVNIPTYLPVSNSKVAYLNLHGSLIQDPASVAACLSELLARSSHGTAPHTSLYSQHIVSSSLEGS